MGDHTETVDMEFDPSQTTYSQLLAMFWKNHDSSRSCSRQYMSAIFYNNNEQKTEAERSVQERARSGTVTTKVLPAEPFYVAEDYHQKYLLQKHPALLEALEIEPGDQLNGSHVAARLNGYVGGYGTLKQFEAEWPNLGITEQMALYIKKVIN